MYYIILFSRHYVHFHFPQSFVRAVFFTPENTVVCLVENGGRHGNMAMRKKKTEPYRTLFS